MPAPASVARPGVGPIDEQRARAGTSELVCGRRPDDPAAHDHHVERAHQRTHPSGRRTPRPTSSTTTPRHDARRGVPTTVPPGERGSWRNHRPGRRRGRAREPLARRHHRAGAGVGERRGDAPPAAHARGRFEPGRANGERARRPARRARIHDDPDVQPPRFPRSRRAQAVGARPARGRDRAHRARSGSRRRSDGQAPPRHRRDRASHVGRRPRSGHLRAGALLAKRPTRPTPRSTIRRNS